MLIIKSLLISITDGLDSMAMGIEVRLDLMLARRKLRLTDLSARVGLSMTNLSLLKTGKVKAIRFSTLAALCRELDCQPGDLLGYVPGDASGARTADAPSADPSTEE